MNPKTITVITSDGTKTYDGTALTAKGKLTGLVSGETVTFRTTGSQTNVGSSENGYILKWNGTAKRSNYVVREVLGTLTVTAAGVVPGTPGTPAGPGGPAAFLPGPPAGPPTDIVEEDPPLTDIEEPTTPLSRFDGAWALINLICMLFTVVISLLLLGLYFVNRKKDEEEENEGEDQEEKTKKKLIIRLLGIIPAVVAIIVFFITEDLTLPMEMVDKYTILMILILFVEVVVAFFARKKTEEEDEDQGQMA